VSTFAARYAGTCAACGAAFPAGAQIERRGRGYAHAACPAAAPAGVVWTGLTRASSVSYRRRAVGTVDGRERFTITSGTAAGSRGSLVSGTRVRLYDADGDYWRTFESQADAVAEAARLVAEGAVLGPRATAPAA
jgi:hypothetical protein